MFTPQLNGNQIVIGTSSDGYFGLTPANVNVPGISSEDKLPDAIDKLIGIIDKLAPAKSPRLNQGQLVFISGGPVVSARHTSGGGGYGPNVVYTTGYSTASAVTGSLYTNVIFSSFPTVRVSDPVTGLGLFTFSDGQSGNLSAWLDNSQIGFRALNSTYHAPGDTSSPDIGTWNQSGTTTPPGSLSITFDQDPFSVAPNTGFWTSLKATMSATQSFSTLDGVEHAYEMRHSTTGNTPLFKFICDSGDRIIAGNINPATNPVFKIGQVNPTRWVSGVPGLSAGDFIIASYTFSNTPASGRYPIVSRFYNSTRITRFTITDNKSVTYGAAATSNFSDDLNANGIPKIGGTNSVPTPFQTQYAVLGLTAAITANMFTAPDQLYDLDFFVTVYNPKGDAMNTTVYNYAGFGGPASTKIYVDTVSLEGTISGSTRVRSGNGIYPIFGTGLNSFGQTYSIYSSTSIRGDQQVVASELMLQNGRFQRPAGNYLSNQPTAGANYDSLDSTHNTTGGVRYATFNCGLITNQKSFTLTIAGGNGITKDGSNPVTNGFELWVTVVNSGVQVVGWLDANKAYNTGDPQFNGDACVDMANTPTGLSRKITFGNPTRTGNVYVRAGLPISSTKYFTNITISII